jgi:O-antigen/teichoic acid export membrane protein
MSMLGMPMGMILVALGVPAAELAFGHEWRSAGFAAMILAGMTTTGIVISFASEILKADGRPDLLTRVRGINLGVGLAAMIALTWAGLYGVCAGLTLGTFVGAVAALIYVARQLELPPSALLAEMAPTAGAATAMAAILTALEFGVVQAGSRGTALGIVLLLAEGALGFFLYLAFLRVFSREHLHEARDLAGRAVPAQLTRRLRRRNDDPADA